MKYKLAGDIVFPPHEIVLVPGNMDIYFFHPVGMLGVDVVVNVESQIGIWGPCLTVCVNLILKEVPSKTSDYLLNVEEQLT